MNPGRKRPSELPEELRTRVRQARDRFDERWQAGQHPEVEAMLDDGDTAYRDAVLRELLPLEIEYRRREGLVVSLELYRARFPGVDQAWLEALVGDPTEDTLPAEGGMRFSSFDSGQWNPAPEVQTPPERDVTPGGPDRTGVRFPPGTWLAERYRVVALLGRGGMGEVYRTDDVQLGETVALKFLPEGLASDPAAQERLRKEIRTARQVTHANVCRIHDLGEADGHIFLTMEYVDGEDLAHVVKRLGRISNERAIEIARQIGLGLRAAHEAGVIHRDLKPANIMLDGQGRVRLLDFGLAGFQEEFVRQPSYSGTAAYMAPELFAGGEPSVQSDIYALGLILYEIYTGRRAFDARELALLKELHRSAVPPLPSSQVGEMDPAVERVIMRCIEKDPRERPSSVDEVLAGLSERASPAATDEVQTALGPARRDERKLVTVLVGGFVTEADSMDPEAERDALDDCFERLIPIAEKYEGTVEESIGDEIVVLFGIPVAHEDDAERAVRAASEMMDALTELNAESGNDMGLRFGLDTGLVVGGGDRSRGRRKSTVTGEAVNLAARLEEVSECGEILVGAATHRLTSRMFEFEALEPIRVKGKEEPARAYRFLTSRSVSPGRLSRGELSSSLVGRETEWRVLLDAVERLRVGVGGVVTLTGEAGLGKSRLVAELRGQIPADTPEGSEGHIRAPGESRPQWVEGRCRSFGGSVAYLLWQDVLRGLLRITGEDLPLAARDVLSECVEALCPDRFDDVFPHLARLLSLPLDGEVETKLQGLGRQGRKFGAFRAVETLIESVARHRGPLVVVCEDLHWADPTSLELLEQLLSLTDRAAVLFICLFRPETEHGCWRIKETAARQHRHRHTDLWLEPLSSAEGEKLVESLLELETSAGGLGERILDHAGGNPFYLEEIVRSLIASGAVVWDDAGSCWRVARTVSEIAIPETLSSVLRARIDRLEDEARRTLQLAAVIGRSFYYRVLEVIAQKGSRLDSELLSLQRQDMIRERSRLPELEYAFKHQLTQKAAYESLLRKERRLLHRQTATALERLFRDRVEEHLELLAYHWEGAEERERAADYLVRAGQKAADRYANTEALEHFDRALRLLQGTDRYQSALARRARVRLETFQGREAAADYEELLLRSRESGDREAELESLLGLAAAFYVIALDDPDFASESRTRYEQAFALADELGDKRAMVRSLVATTWFTDYWPEYWDRAVANVGRAWAISQTTSDEDLICECRIARANLDLESIEEVEELLVRFKSRHDLLRFKEAAFRLNWRHLFTGNFTRCVEGCDVSAALSTRLGIQPVMYSTIRALALLDLGRYAAAEDSLQREIADEEYRLGRALRDFGAGVRLLELMAYEDAASVFESVIVQAEQVGRAWLRLWAEAERSRSLLGSDRLDELDLDWINQDLTHASSHLPAVAPQISGEVALREGKLDEALRQAETARAIAEAQGWWPSYVTALELRLRILLRLGRPAEVISLAGDGLEKAERMEYRPLIWRLRSARAQALTVEGDVEAAAREYRAAAGVLRELADAIGDARLTRGFLANTAVSRVLEIG